MLFQNDIQNKIYNSQTKKVSKALILQDLYKMEIVNHVSVFQNYQNFSDVIAERPKLASENSQPIKTE